MPVTIVLGAQWGDEGKGRIIDLLAEEAHYVVRFQGGSNAGHTLFDSQGKKIVLHQIPSGILRADKICVIGNGVVLDPVKLVEEIESVRQAGYLKKETQLVISDGCHLVMPYHQELDRLEEAARSTQKIGTTGKGIGPTYTDKVSRIGIRLCDLMEPQRFRQRLEQVLPIKNLLLQKLYGHPGMNLEEILTSYLAAAKTLAPFVAQVPPLLHAALKQGKRLLCEGAQGSELDVDHGTYPYVTSSNTLAGAALLGSGIPAQSITKIIGIVKAYSTRVGSGPFPTEDSGEAGERLCSKGNEFGSTTGRKRRCGWLDIPQLRHSIMLNGMDSIILTKLDILSGFAEVPLCVAYEYKGKRLDVLPTQTEILADVKPIYEVMPGWEIDSGNLQTFAELPKQARQYIKKVADYLDCPIELASVGPQRDNFLMANKQPFTAFLNPQA